MKVKERGQRRAAQHHPHPQPHFEPPAAHVGMPRAARESGPAGRGGDGPANAGLERELKFEVPPAVAAAVRRDLDALGAGAEPFVASYHDTADGRLYKAGISLRLRQEGERWTQTIKLAQSDLPLARTEHEVAAAPDADGGVRLDLARHAGSEALAAVRAALAGHGGLDGLAERHVSDVVRRRVPWSFGATRAEIAFDEGVLRAGDQEAPVCELEFELKEGLWTDMAVEAADWVRRHGLWLAVQSKSDRGARLAGWASPQPAVKAGKLRLKGKAGAAAVAQQMVRGCLDQILPNAAAVAAGARDDERVHQLRVGLRRLRTVMRELAVLAPGLEPAWEAPLALAFHRLGTYRDRATVLGSLRPQLLAAGAPGVGWTEPSESPVDPCEVARAPDFQAALVRLVGYAHAEPHQTPETPSLRRTLRARLRDLHHRVVRGGKRFARLDAEHQHGVRKRLKRLRYLSELAASLYEPKPVKRYLRALEPAQDALGRHNDLAVAAGVAAEAREKGDAEAGFAVDWLACERRASARHSRRALKKIAGAGGFWRKRG